MICDWCGVIRSAKSNIKEPNICRLCRSERIPDYIPEEQEQKYFEKMQFKK